MSWLISAKQYIPAVIGEPFGGGYFAGYISHTADGNPTHALIVAPRATGATGTGYTLTTGRAWKTTDTTTAGTFSEFDGVINTTLMVNAGIASHPAAQFCVNLNIDGFTDWYLPARYELEIAYFNLKPSADSNSSSVATSNPYSVPQRNTNYTSSNPAQSSLAAWRSTPSVGSQSFVAAEHWSSTQMTNILSRYIRFFNGDQGNYGFTKTYDVFRVRAFRRIAL